MYGKPYVYIHNYKHNPLWFVLKNSVFDMVEVEIFYSSTSKGFTNMVQCEDGQHTLSPKTRRRDGSELQQSE